MRVFVCGSTSTAPTCRRIHDERLATRSVICMKYVSQSGRIGPPGLLGNVVLAFYHTLHYNASRAYQRLVACAVGLAHAMLPMWVEHRVVSSIRRGLRDARPGVCISCGPSVG